MLAEDMHNWTPRPRPARTLLDGRYVTIAPFDAPAHQSGLFQASAVSDADQRFTWLSETPTADQSAFAQWFDMAAASEDPLFFVVIDKATQQVAGRQTLMRMDPANGVVEIGNIYWGPLIARRPAATEALYLFARHIFDDLGYRRFEWKCNDDNGPSKRAALRFGFQYEGLFRQHLIVKGLNRDTAWFAMIDKDWPALRTAYQAWLDPSNFDETGSQRRRLEDFRP